MTREKELHAPTLGATDDEREELFARYSLGIAEPAERRALEQHLGEGCVECAAALEAMAVVTGELALQVDPVPVSGALRDRVLAAVDEAATASERGFHFVVAEEGGWRDLGDGVQHRALGRDPITSSISYLVRVAPGASVPSHAHRGTEHCWVVEGDFIVDGRVLRSGDYHRADAGTIHRSLRSEHGCVFLVVEARPPAAA
jgi:anti-sigma factor ChrR (cupin superfamily)